MTKVIDVNPWVADKEQKRFHDIKVEHDILRYKINTRINTSKCLFENIPRQGDHIPNYLLTEGSAQTLLAMGRINLLFMYPIVDSMHGFANNKCAYSYNHIHVCEYEYEQVFARATKLKPTYIFRHRQNNSSIKTFLTNPNCSVRF